jgi:hypothetical protein
MCTNVSEKHLTCTFRADVNIVWLERKRALSEKVPLDSLLPVVLVRVLCYSSFLCPRVVVFSGPMLPLSPFPLAIL